MGDFPLDHAQDEGHVQQNPPKQTPSDAAAVPPPVVTSQPTPEHGHAFQPQNHLVSPQGAFTTQLDMSQFSTAQRPGPYSMAPMANALPQMNFRSGHPPGGQQRYNFTASSPSMMQPMPQYAGHSQVPVAAPGFYVQQPQMNPYYGAQLPQSQPASSMSPRHGGMPYYPGHMMMNQQQPGYYFPPNPHYPPSTQPVSNSMGPGHYMGITSANNNPRITVPPIEEGIPVQPPQTRQPQGSERRQSTVRGPPRKPRQSGHAIWIGNLPPQTELMNLVHHVCKEAPGLESLFLISKSNCAFANFEDDETCTAAQQKLHDSKFQTVRLVSRLRKSTVEGTTGVTAPTGPAVVPSGPASGGNQVQEGVSASETSSPTTEKADVSRPGTQGESTPQKDKFFILKSLTVEDLELSVRTGIWATQAHNEEALNKAFKGAESVYLVFSANKSGEYFGYAKMTSSINEDPAAAIEFAPAAQVATDLDLPKAIPTEATEFAPKGRIIDDSARGTIFWEAEKEDSGNASDVESEVSSSKSAGDDEPATKTWGKPFKLEWLSTTRLPFYRTRGLRNPWNSHREVKIARDGTELEPTVGRRLIGLFNRIHSPGPAQTNMGMPVAIIPGYPPLQHYG